MQKPCWFNRSVHIKGANHHKETYRKVTAHLWYAKQIAKLSFNW